MERGCRLSDLPLLFYLILALTRNNNIIIMSKNRLIVLLLSLTVGLSLTLQAQDTTYARSIIRTLAGDAMHGRGASYGGDSLAAAYLRSELIRLGVEPLANNYYQSYTFNTFSMEGPCWMKVNNRQLKVYDEFRPTLWSSTINDDDIEVVKVPIETFLDGTLLQQFIAKRKNKLSNCFIYLDCSQVQFANQQEERNYRQRMAELRRRNSFGSRGIIVGLNNLNTSSPAGCDYDHGYDYIEVLASVMPKRIKQLGVGITSQFRRNHPTQNVLGMVRGEVDTMIVYTAHYDHLGIMGKALNPDNEHLVGKEVIFRGAHDNASGVAAVLDLARMAVAEKPHYTTVFMFFSGEESGLKGSAYQAEHPSIDYSKVRLLINIDLFCGGEEGLMVFNAKAPNTQFYFDRMVKLNEALQVAPEIRPRDLTPNSDHWSFRNLCPVLYVLSMGQPYGGYHSPSDDCAGCGLQYYHNHLVLISTLGY